MLAGSLAFAAPAFATGAVRTTDEACNVFDPDLDSVPATNHQSVTAPSGELTLTCSTTLNPPPVHAILLNNANTSLDCITDAGHTQDWHETISAGGKVVLVCHFHP